MRASTSRATPDAPGSRNVKECPGWARDKRHAVSMPSTGTTLCRSPPPRHRRQQSASAWHLTSADDITAFERESAAQVTVYVRSCPLRTQSDGDRFNAAPPGQHVRSLHRPCGECRSIAAAGRVEVSRRPPVTPGAAPTPRSAPAAQHAQERRLHGRPHLRVIGSAMLKTITGTPWRCLVQILPVPRCGAMMPPCFRRRLSTQKLIHCRRPGRAVFALIYPSTVMGAAAAPVEERFRTIPSQVPAERCPSYGWRDVPPSMLPTCCNIRVRDIGCRTVCPDEVGVPQEAVRQRHGIECPSAGAISAG